MTLKLEKLKSYYCYDIHSHLFFSLSDFLVIINA